jgi:hypothetical protein
MFLNLEAILFNALIVLFFLLRVIYANFKSIKELFKRFVSLFSKRSLKSIFEISFISSKLGNFILSSKNLMANSCSFPDNMVESRE